MTRGASINVVGPVELTSSQLRLLLLSVRNEVFIRGMGGSQLYFAYRLGSWLHFLGLQFCLSYVLWLGYVLPCSEGGIDSFFDEFRAS